MNSKIITIDSGIAGPTIGLVGLVHGDEQCGRIILDELADYVPKIGKLKLVYANLAAADKGQRKIEADLNRVFPGKQDGNLEEQIAFNLQKELSLCDYVIDIHSSIDDTPAFAISTVDNEDYEKMVREIGLEKYVIMTDKLANGKSLIDYVNSIGGKGISFEAGDMHKEEAIINARNVVRNFLVNKGLMEGSVVVSDPEKFMAYNVITVPSKEFVCYTPKCFELLKAGTPYGRMDDKEYALDKDCYPILAVSRPFEAINMVFIACRKE